MTTPKTPKKKQTIQQEIKQIEKETTQINREIKKLENANQIKAIRTEYSSNSVELKFIFYNNYGFNYSQKRALRDQANSLLENLGYNTKHISVSY